MNEGLELIQKVFEIHPNWWPVYKWKGIGLYKMGEYEASLEYLKKSEELVNTFKYDIYQYIRMAEQAIDSESQ